MPGLNDFEDYISPLIERQFPAIYREDGPEFVAFVKAYYEYLEQTDKDLYITRKLFEYNDVDQSVDSFLDYFRKQFLLGFPKTINQGIPFTVKHIMDLYRSKGTPRAVELFLRLAYGIDSSLYIPGQHTVTASDADFYQPRYIEVIVDYNKDSAFSDYAGKDITGTISGATATVDSVLKTSAMGKITYVMFLTGITGIFKRGELIEYSGSTYSPKIVGSLSNISLTANGTGLTVGDELDVTSLEYGTQGLARVTGITDGTGRASYAINDTGFGYSTNSALSNVLVSTATLAVNNYTNGDATVRAEYGGNNFFILETITQPVEIIDYTTDSTSMASNVNTTTYVVGTNSSITSLNGSNHLANGQVSVVSNTGANGTLTLIINEGTFGNQVQYYHQSNTIGFEVGEKVSVNSTVYGYLNAANSTVLTMNATTTGFSNLATQQVTGERSGAVSNGISAASKLVQTGVKKLFLAATLAVNANTSAVSNAYRTGTLIGANSTAVGLVANSTDIYLTSPQNFIKGSDSNTYANVTAVRLGTDASLTIGTLGPDTESKNVYTNFISSTNNSANTDILDVIINGSNSGVGIVNSVTITTAGSGYANGESLVFTANSTIFGGITSGALPTLNAIATVGTDGSGVITSVTMTGQGNGYYHAPKITITTSGGSSGVLTPVMHFAYGLPKHGNTINTTHSGGYSNVLNDVLEFSVTTLGQINTFSSTSGGNSYTAPPFVLVQNRLVDKFNQRNANITYDTFVSDTQSNFAVDDVIVQTQSQEFLYINISSNTAAFTVGEGTVQAFNATVNNYGTVTAANDTVITIREIKGRKVESSGYINIGLTGHDVDYATGNTFIGLSSNSYANITGQSNTTENRFVKGRVLGSNTDNDTMEVRLHDSRFDFVVNTNIHIEDYSSQANLVQYYYHTANTSTRTTGLRLDERAGLSANINVAATTSSGLISSLQVVRSGYGYLDGETVTMSGGDLESISGTAVVNNHGISPGHHRTNRGFLNEDKYIHDNDYYQEYSYEVRSELPLDKYKQPLKDIVHLAGTRLFGQLQTSATAGMALSVANASVSQA